MQNLNDTQTGWRQARSAWAKLHSSAGKLGKPFFDEASRRVKNKSKHLFTINLTGNPNSCLIKVQKHSYRALIDSGAELTLASHSVYDSLKVKPKLQHKNVLLQTVNGEPLKVDGCAEIAFEIGGMKTSHLFFIVKNMNRKVILGRDWLQQNGVRLYFDLGRLRFNETYIPLQEDNHVSSVVRMQSKVTIKPQTAVVCNCKAKAKKTAAANFDQNLKL